MDDSTTLPDGGRRSNLLGAKLRALVGDHLGVSVDTMPEPVPAGVGMVHDAAAWMLLDGDASGRLGAALAWAVRRGASSLDLVVESGGGALARRAEAFSLPIAVWFAEGRSLLPVVAEPLRPPPAVAAEHRAFAPVIARAGAQPNEEHGVVFGEVCGLEVCRVVDEPTTGFFAEPGTDVPLPATVPRGIQLEVGVGAADREAFQMLHGDMPTPEALASVVAAVSQHRSIDAGRHPLNRLGRERFVRWLAVESPLLVGLAELSPAEPPVPRPNLKDPVPCVALGAAGDGEEIVVVFSTGVDLDLLPFVADVQRMYPQPVRVALPKRDHVALTRDLAGLLVDPIEFVTLDV